MHKIVFADNRPAERAKPSDVVNGLYETRSAEDMKAYGDYRIVYFAQAYQAVSNGIILD